MATFSGKHHLVLAAAFCLGWSAAHAQGEPVKYWIPFGPFGVGYATEPAGGATYGNFPGFDVERTEKSGFSFRTYSAPVNSLTNGFGRSDFYGGAFGNSLSYESSQFGYTFKGVGDAPVTLFGGVDSLKYNPDVFSTITSFSPAAGATPAYGVHAGVEIRPTSNLSLSFSAGYTQQQSGLADGDISSSLLPRELGGRR
ncbi:MAG: hypothetical protein NTAFB05_18010 [Nitrobacter sp.]|uniref:hypothetical protein n=1 Tax=Nitrobacter sp. TaxID=29420 RepID=UPI00387DEC0B